MLWLLTVSDAKRNWMQVHRLLPFILFKKFHWRNKMRMTTISLTRFYGWKRFSVWFLSLGNGRATFFWNYLCDEGESIVFFFPFRSFTSYDESTCSRSKCTSTTLFSQRKNNDFFNGSVTIHQCFVRRTKGKHIEVYLEAVLPSSLSLPMTRMEARNSRRHVVIVIRRRWRLFFPAISGASSIGKMVRCACAHVCVYILCNFKAVKV